MAFGFPPNYTEEYYLKNLDKEHFLIFVIEAAAQLHWTINFIHPTGLVAHTKFSWSSWSEEVTIKIDQEIVTIKSECSGSQFIDWGKNKKNIKRLLLKVEEVRNSLTQNEIDTKLIELNNSYQPIEEDILSKSHLKNEKKKTGFFSFLDPTKGIFISSLLIAINIIIFILMLINGVDILLPESQDLIKWGANFRPITLEGQWWRLITACFVHIGISHLIFNMYALIYIGMLLEPCLGKVRFFVAYIISGIAASMTSLWWHDLTISAGASGAIFGMYGVFLAFLTTNLFKKSVRKSLIVSIAIFIVYNILQGLNPDSNIDNASHIGGLITGLIIGYSFIPSLKRPNNQTIQFSTISILAIILLGSSVITYQSLPNDIGKYGEKMKEFFSMESMALEVYNLPQDTPTEKILSEIKNRGLYYWEENIKLLDSFNDLQLPAIIQMRNNKLKEYCELRIKSYELIYKAIAEETDLYENQINEYNEKIEIIIAELIE